MTGIELSRRERKKEETKDRIFKAAITLFKDKGFEATTVDDITERADVAKGTFFNYFPRKEAVLGYLPELWIEQAEEKAQAILAGQGPAAEKIRDMFAEFAGFYEEDPDLSKHIVLEWTRRHQGVADDMCRRWDDLGVTLIRHLQANGEVRPEVDAERAHEVLEAVYHGTLMRWCAADDKPFPLKQELSARLSLAMEGLTACRRDIR